MRRDEDEDDILQWLHVNICCKHSTTCCNTAQHVATQHTMLQHSHTMLLLAVAAASGDEDDDDIPQRLFKWMAAGADVTAIQVQPPQAPRCGAGLGEQVSRGACPAMIRAARCIARGLWRMLHAWAWAAWCMGVGCMVHALWHAARCMVAGMAGLLVPEANLGGRDEGVAGIARRLQGHAMLHAGCMLPLYVAASCNGRSTLAPPNLAWRMLVSLSAFRSWLERPSEQVYWRHSSNIPAVPLAPWMPMSPHSVALRA